VLFLRAAALAWGCKGKGQAHRLSDAGSPQERFPHQKSSELGVVHREFTRSRGAGPVLRRDKSPGVAAFMALSVSESESKLAINILNPESKAAHARILSGSAVLLLGSGCATAINFAYNVAVAKFLGPVGFGHAAAVYTLLIFMSAVTLSFQIVSAKVVVQQKSPGGKSAAYQGFHLRAWACGLLLAVLLGLFRNVISGYLNLPSSTWIVLLGVGVAFYIPLGSRRGYLQGVSGFHVLATNVVLEGLVRLGGSFLLIKSGLGVTGVVAANAGAVATAYFAAAPKIAAVLPSDLRIRVAFREGLQAAVFFAGQVVINNCDIVLVKHFFEPKPAGLYAAVALVGRVVYVLSWAVVTTMFPVSAETSKQQRRDPGILGTSMALVFAVGSLISLGLWLAPAGIWAIFFGSGFEAATGAGLPHLLGLYAATTCLYSLSVVIVAYEMSYKIANTSWVQLAFSTLLIAGIYRFHSSLEQVIEVQFVMMIVLLGIVAVPFLVNAMNSSREESPARAAADEIRVIRQVSQDEVIAEFLRNDFYHPEFQQYRESLGDIVTMPDFGNTGENALRRALFFIRHGALWRELPPGVAWWEAEISRKDLANIRVFPRAQWRKLARGNFAITHIAECIAAGRGRGVRDAAFLGKLEELRRQVRESRDAPGGAVVLIGRHQGGPFTVLDGNHRLVAALSVSAEKMDRFRFFCGVSPRMGECCWHETNLKTLARYGTNLLRNLVHDPQEELSRLLQNS
jgi:O-antigen/teichoic acid export membrane protein